MNRRIIPLALALGASACLTYAQDSENGPARSKEPEPQLETQGTPSRAKVHVMPPGASENLNLTADQKKQVDALEADVKARLEKILTPKQLKQLEQMRPHHRSGTPDGAEGAQPPAPAGK